jgi:4-hydroxybenzoate polyprenyltransferase
MAILGGYIFDIYGRKFTVYFSMLFSGLMIVFVPIAAPSRLGYVTFILLVNVLLSPCATAPIIQDYVLKESYGKAQAFSKMGMCIGVVVSLSLLFDSTKTLDP